MENCHARHPKYKCALIVYVSIFVYVVQAVRPVCDILPADLTEPTTLTCFFPKYFVQSKSGFRVVHLTRNISVVSSIWENAERSFSLEEGFSMDGQNFEDQVTFNINRVSLNDTGTYACIPKGYKPEDVGTCTLHLRTELPKKLELVTARESHSQNCTCPTDLNAVFFTAVIAVPVLSVVVIALVLYICITTQRRERDEHRNASSQAVQPDEEKPLTLPQNGNLADKNNGCALENLLKLFFARPAEKVGLSMDRK